MNLVADESCAGPVVQALRKAGHDVIAIGTQRPEAGVDVREI